MKNKLVMDIKSIAYIIDGNRRWAVARGLNKIEGHQYGAENILKTISWSKELGIENISFYIFSLENWKRSKFEVNAFMLLFEKMFSDDLNKLLRAKVAVKFIGDISKIPKRLHKILYKVENETKHFKTKVFFALSYGGQDEIIHGCREASKNMNKKQLSKITKKQFENFLWTKDIPDPDLVIRTGGRKRLSNFFLWKISYSEIYFIDTMWPAFSKKILNRIVKHYIDKVEINKGI